MIPTYDIFPHEGKFIIIKHLTGARAGYALGIWDHHKLPRGHIAEIPVATAYELALQFKTRDAAERYLATFKAQYDLE